MISIVVCSINEIHFSQFELSVKDTIDIAYEIIKIENTISEFPLSKAYNMGAKKAKFPFICFVHEDVIFKNNGWGAKLVEFFNANPDVGLIGIAGSTVKTLTPSIWANGLYDTDYYNLIQYYKKSDSTVHLQYKEGEENYKEVKTLDGVFLFTKKEIWEANKFDEELAKFHCYDLDFGFQIGQTKKIFVTYDVLLEHLSTGGLSKEWVEASIKLSKKWAHLLPLGDLDRKKMKALEWKNKKTFFFRMNILKFPISEIAVEFMRWNYFKNFSISNNLNFIKEIIELKFTKKKNK